MFSHIWIIQFVCKIIGYHKYRSITMNGQELKYCQHCLITSTGRKLDIIDLLDIKVMEAHEHMRLCLSDPIFTKDVFRIAREDNGNPSDGV